MLFSALVVKPGIKKALAGEVARITRDEGGH